MSRTRKPEPYVRQKVSIPATLMARFARLHWDPVLTKPKYGSISEVLSALLADYVSRREQGEDPLAKSEQPTNLEQL